MSKAILIGLIFLSALCANAQLQKVIDSLKLRAQQNPAERASLYSQLNEAWVQANFDSALHYGTLLYREAALQQDTVNLIAGLRAIGRAYDYDYQIDSARQYYEQALLLATQVRDDNLMGSGYFNLGTLYLLSGQYAEAILSYEEALELFEKTGDQQENLSKVYNNMGIIFRRTRQYDKAIDLYRRALTQQSSISEGQFSNLTVNLANAFISLSQYDSAEKYFNAIKLYAQKQDPVLVLYISNGLGIVSYERKDMEMARRYFQQAAQDNYINDSNLKITALGYLATVESETKNADKATLYFDQAMPYVSETELADQSLLLYAQLAAHYERQRDFARALEYQKKYASLNEKLLSKEVIDRTTEWVQRYQTKEKEAEIAELKIANQQAELIAQDKTNQRNVFVFSTIILLLAAIAAWFLYRNRKRAAQLLETKNQTIHQALTENKLLTKEIHHRVKNNLQVIISLLNLQSHFANDSKTAKAMAESKNRVFAMSLIHESLYVKDDQLSINVKDYLTTLLENLEESMHQPDKAISLRLALSEHWIDADKAVPLGLIANELVTNSFKHAFLSRQTGSITVTYMLTTTQAILTVADDGIGATDLPEETRKSLGTTLIRDLSKKLRAQLTIQNTSGMNTCICIPIIEKV